MSGRLEGLADGFRPAGLEEVDRRAALQRRVDKKYVVSLDEVASLFDAVRENHEALEIDGRRVFEYESIYFDTPSLECFHDHTAGRRPRYKARTRCYVSTGSCFFEVKVKRTDGETVKQSLEYDPDDRRDILEPAQRLLSETLAGCGLDGSGRQLDATLVTRFRRVTLAAVELPQRITIDFGIELDAPGRGTARLDDGFAVVETKTPEGRGPCDSRLAELGAEATSLSKYRLGVGLLVSSDDDGYAPTIKAKFALR